MRKKLLSILALLCLTVSSAWAEWNGETYTATGEENLGSITVTADTTLNINAGVTVTVTGGIVTIDDVEMTNQWLYSGYNKLPNLNSVITSDSWTLSPKTEEAHILLCRARCTNGGLFCCSSETS